MNLSRRINVLRSDYVRVFFIAFLTSLCFLLPYMIFNGGPFLFFGDFDVQQVPFYILANRAIRTGDIFWSHLTDLGTNFIGSYSFSLITSPFFMLTLLLPEKWVPYSLGWLLALKFAFAAVTALAYLKLFVKNRNYAMIGALLYAFSGFQIYNIFFNNFHEAVVFFPLLLYGLERLLRDGRKGYFAIAVFINAFVNYFFFFGEVVFLVLYFLMRLFSSDWRLSFKRILCVAFESIVGVGLSCIVLIPAVLIVSSNTRMESSLSGWYMLLYLWPQRYAAIVHCFFFPPDLPSRPNFFPEGNAKWASLGAWLPLFSMSGLFAWIQSRKNDWLKYILNACIIIAMVPGLNQLFYAMNLDYYARWFYMFILMIVLATVKSLETPKVDFIRGIRYSFVITLCIALPLGLLTQNKNGKEVIGLIPYPERFWTNVAIAVGALVVLYVIYRFMRANQARFERALLLGVVLFSIIAANAYIVMGLMHSYDHVWLKENCIDNADSMKLEGTEIARVDIYDDGGANQALDNQAMFFHLPTIQAFHSVVPRSIMEFYPAVGVPRDVGSRPEINHIGLRSLLSVRWLLARDNVTEVDMEGFRFVEKRNSFSIFENENYIPMGFIYDKYVDKEGFEDTSESLRDRLLVKAIYLSDEQIKKYGKFYEKLDTSGYVDLSYDALVEDSAARRSTSAYSAVKDNRGFTFEMNSDKQTLAFFSIPYDEGFTATVNGKPVTIEKVNVGFMAVEIQPGKNVIRFDYFTPGLNEGIIITITSLVLVIAYLLIDRKLRERTPALVSASDAASGVDMAQLSSDTEENAEEAPVDTSDIPPAQDEAPTVETSGSPESGDNGSVEE